MSNWKPAELKVLHQIVSRTEGKPTRREFGLAAKRLGKSVSSCERKYARTDWRKLIAMEYGIDPGEERRPWTANESRLLYDLKVTRGLDYDDIADILKRSKTSCERHFQRTDWASVVGNPRRSLKGEILKARRDEQRAAEEEEERAREEESDERDEHHAHVKAAVVDWLIITNEYEPAALMAMDEATFNSKLEKMLANPDAKIVREDITASFEEIRADAMAELDRLGMTYPKSRTLGPGRYIVCGDSHGRHTSLGTFKLLQVLNRELGCKNLLHMNDISDDNDEISYAWHEFDNLIVVGRLNELHLLKKQVHKYDVVRGRVMLGNFAVENQYDHGDFVKKGIGRIDPLTIPDSAIVCSHRQEMHSHCGYKRERLVVSPGCLCRRHPIRTTKQLIFKHGLSVRQTYSIGFKKFLKQEQDSARWENGIVVVEVDRDCKATVHPLRIFDTPNHGKATCYAGKAYTERGVFDPERKYFINGDMHCNHHDPRVLDVQEQFCADYKPDVHVNVGDLLDNRGLNHHMGGTTGPAFYKDGDRLVYGDSVFEIASARNVMRRMRRWAPESHLIIGNHERFASDLATRMPQLQDLLTPEFLLGVERLGIKVTPLKGTLDFGHIRFVHGDVKVWGGVGGSKLDKVANNYGQNTVMGNIHYPAIRAGCYSVPMSGLLDQKYNEADASQWMQGFAYADVFDGVCFVSIVVIMGGQCVVNGKKYVARDVTSWETPKYKASLEFEFEGQPASSPANAPASPVAASAAVGAAKGSRVPRIKG